MTSIWGWIASFSLDTRSYPGASLLRKALYGLAIYNIIFLALPLHDVLWGSDSLVAPMSFPAPWTSKLIMLLHDDAFASWYPLFMLLPVIGVLLYLFRGYTRWSALLVYVGVVVLFNRTYTFLTGGNYLFHCLLFYLLFIDEKGRGGVISGLLSNLGVWACRLQLIIVYLFTGAYKLAGEMWRDGEAVYHITHIREFTLPWFAESVAEAHSLMVLANYSSLVYFFLFPILVWSKKYKLKLLAFGVLFHLGLGLVIGVMDFSLVMIVSYAAFLDKESVASLKGLFTKQKVALGS